MSRSILFMTDKKQEMSQVKLNESMQNKVDNQKESLLSKPHTSNGKITTNMNNDQKENSNSQSSTKTMKDFTQEEKARLKTLPAEILKKYGIIPQGAKFQLLTKDEFLIHPKLIEQQLLFLKAELVKPEAQRKSISESPMEIYRDYIDLIVESGIQPYYDPDNDELGFKGITLKDNFNKLVTAGYLDPPK